MKFHKHLLWLPLLGVTSLASAWVDSGHMTIAAIAYDHLTPTARAEADELLKVGGTPETNDFLTAACWADDIRRDRRETGPWHYIDLHFRSDSKVDTNKPEAENVVWAISKFKKVLEDKSESKENRAEALRFLLHFVGDIHQPLHAVSRDTDTLPAGDAGGNKYPILPPSSMMGDRPPHNLHALWDLGCGLFPSTNRGFRPLDSNGKAEILAIAKQIEASHPFSMKILSESNPMQWAEEGQKISEEFVYTLPEGTGPSSAYLTHGKEIAATRAAEAGYRLSALLNTALK